MHLRNCEIILQLTCKVWQQVFFFLSSVGGRAVKVTHCPPDKMLVNIHFVWSPDQTYRHRHHARYDERLSHSKSAPVTPASLESEQKNIPPWWIQQLGSFLPVWCKLRPANIFGKEWHLQAHINIMPFLKSEFISIYALNHINHLVYSSRCIRSCVFLRDTKGYFDDWREWGRALHWCMNHGRHYLSLNDV